MNTIARAHMLASPTSTIMPLPLVDFPMLEYQRPSSNRKVNLYHETNLFVLHVCKHGKIKHLVKYL